MSPRALLLLAALAALVSGAPPWQAASGETSEADIVVATAAPDSDRVGSAATHAPGGDCCCGEAVGCGEPAEPCGPDADCCAACVACSARAAHDPRAEPAPTGPREPHVSWDGQTRGAGVLGAVWHPPRA